MGKFYLLIVLFFSLYFADGAAQCAVKGSLVLESDKNKAFVVRNTKIILVSKKSRDTVMVNDDLTFNFLEATPGKGYLYVLSPALPNYTEYKFRVKKKRPTYVNLKYEKFTHSSRQPAKTPEEREADLQKGLLITRVALDIFFIFQSFHR